VQQQERHLPQQLHQGLQLQARRLELLAAQALLLLLLHQAQLQLLQALPEHQRPYPLLLAQLLQLQPALVQPPAQQQQQHHHHRQHLLHQSPLAEGLVLLLLLLLQQARQHPLLLLQLLQMCQQLHLLLVAL
jgi:hypothetical protein